MGAGANGKDQRQSDDCSSEIRQLTSLVALSMPQWQRPAMRVFLGV
jgi:hypothetical protein